jgi:hypothetical protein
MEDSTLARRLRRLPIVELEGHEVPTAVGFARLLGLAWLDRDQAGAGLLLPRCRSVHTFGMRFALDVHFLDASLETIALVRGVGPRRIVSHGAAKAVLELPATGGEPTAGRP